MRPGMKVLLVKGKPGLVLIVTTQLRRLSGGGVLYGNPSRSTSA